MTDQTLPKRRGRPKGVKNRSKKPTEVVALRALDASFVESAYKFLAADLDKLPVPRTAMDRLMQHTYEMALAGEKTSHQYAKLIFERAIPQRKQVEHLGEADAQRLGVNINVITEKAQELPDEQEPGITIEHESGAELQPDGAKRH